MTLDASYRPEFDSMKALLLEIAEETSTERLFARIVERLAARPHVALSRVWVLGAGDRCDRCPMRPGCADRQKCLHLTASAGSALHDTRGDGSRTDGYFSRIPVGSTHRVGQIAATGKGHEVDDLQKDGSWVHFPEWVETEQIVGFGGQPLSHRGEVLGVLAIFTRIPLVNEGSFWLQMTANQAAAAMVNARTVDQIEAMKERIELENTYLKEELDQAQAFGEMIGQGPAFQHLLQQIELVAPTDASVLILGESGTGKELVAREIHGRSRRRDSPLIKVNCASIPRELYESEFFGHSRGAFTGAIRNRTGRFEAADGGTLFLDEVGEIPHELQSKLLRVLQEGQFERVGEAATRRVDVRIIAATNRDLKVEVDARRFRQDLFYRLNVFPIELEPLARRKEDIPLLAAHFLRQSAVRLNCPTARLTRANLLALQRYRWPGNVRELKNIIERAVILSRCGPLRFEFPDAGAPLQTTASGKPADPRDRILTEAELRELERGNLKAALQKTGWKIYGKGGAAELLGLKPTTLSARIRRFGLQRPR
jgi:transcriptional regulator with GAF, ATPase, and Fis domain